MLRVYHVFCVWVYVRDTSHEWITHCMYDSTTHCSSQAEVKSTLVHEVPHHWEATTDNCTVKTCPTIIIHLKHPVSKEGQQVLHTLKGSTIGSPVKDSEWTLCTWLVSWVECCTRLWVHTDECDSLVFCETHLPHVPPTSSAQGGGSSLQHTSLVLMTTEENNQNDIHTVTKRIHMLPPPVPTLTIHSPSTSHHIAHYQIGVCDRVWGGSKAPVCHKTNPGVWHCLWPVVEILALSKSNTHPTHHVQYNNAHFPSHLHGQHKSMDDFDNDSINCVWNNVKVSDSTAVLSM